MTESQYIKLFRCYVAELRDETRMAPGWRAREIKNEIKGMIMAARLLGHEGLAMWLQVVLQEFNELTFGTITK